MNPLSYRKQISSFTDQTFRFIVLDPAPMEQPQTAPSVRPPRVRPGDFAQNFEAAFAKFQVAVETAYAAEPDWPMQAAAAIRAVLEFAAEDPIAAHALTVDSLAQGSGHFAHRRPVDRLARLLATGRDGHPEGETLPGLLEDALAGGIFMLIVQRLEVGGAKTLAALIPDAIEFALTPYVGRDKARDVAMAGGRRRGPYPEPLP
jgi:hypothetical protein